MFWPVKITLLIVLILSLMYPISSVWAMDDDVKVDFDDVTKVTNCIQQSTTNSLSSQYKTQGGVKLWFEEPNYDSCPRTFRALGCQEHLLDGYEKRDYMLPVDLVFYIRNDTGFLLRIGDEQFTCGYYCLEIDMRLANGKIFTVRRREGVWYRNFINEEDVCGEKIHRRLVSLNPRLWTGLPSEVRGDKVYLRPRFAFFSFVNAGRHYKSTSDLRAGRELKSWNGSRDGELVGDWLIISADRFRSWVRSDLREGNRRSVP